LQGNPKTHTQVIAILKVLQKKGEEKYKENKMNFEGAYLGNS